MCQEFTGKHLPAEQRGSELGCGTWRRSSHGAQVLIKSMDTVAAASGEPRSWGLCTQDLEASHQRWKGAGSVYDLLGIEEETVPDSTHLPQDKGFCKGDNEAILGGDGFAFIRSLRAPGTMALVSVRTRWVVSGELA